MHNHLRQFLAKIDPPGLRAGATEDHIGATEARLGGRFPELLRCWYREVDGFDGEAQLCMWRFKSLDRVHLTHQHFPSVREFSVPEDGLPPRIVDCSHYAVILDAFINLPFHAVNVRPDSPCYSEVLCAAEETPAVAHVAASSFEVFARRIAAFPDDPFCIK